MPDSKQVRLKDLHVYVTMADDTEHTVQIRNPELCRWDLVRADKGWPSMEDAPVLWQTFVAWAAMKRAGIYAGEFQAFREVDCMGVEDPDEPGADVDPTPPGLVPGLPSQSPPPPG
jgi:hypothetical protein